MHELRAEVLNLNPIGKGCSKVFLMTLSNFLYVTESDKLIAIVRKFPCRCDESFKYLSFQSLVSFVSTHKIHKFCNFNIFNE